jgi:hypothetical protein
MQLTKLTYYTRPVPVPRPQNITPYIHTYTTIYGTH